MSDKLWATPRGTDGERGGRGDLLAMARGYQMAHNGTLLNDLSQLTLFAEAFPVSRTPSLADVPAPPTPATPGLTSLDSFASLNPDGSWRKTSQGYCQLMLDGSSEPFSETWPRAGMTPSGTAYRRPPLAPLTDAIASGLWHTPNAADAWVPMQISENTLRRGDPNGSVRTTSGSLATHVAHAQMRPTPCAEDAKNVPYQKGKDGVTRYPMLLGAVEPSRMWPTLRTEDSQCASGHRGQDDTLYGAICKPRDGSTEAPGQLNPTWVSA